MKILIVDDHPIIREGLAALLTQIAENTTTIQACSVDEAFAALGQDPGIDIVVLDLKLPGTNGMDAIAGLGQRRPDLPVVVLSSSEEAQDARKALELGALGYVPKSASPHVVLAAIRLVLDGEVYIPPLLLTENSDPARPIFVDATLEGAHLTDRQTEILRWVSAGHSNKSIARALGVSEKTVKVHVTAIFKALRVVNRTQAAAAGWTNKLT